MTVSAARAGVLERCAVALREATAKIGSVGRAAWRAVRHGAGDDAYERYLAHHAQCHADAPPLDRRQYYLERQRRKWDGVQRCC